MRTGPLCRRECVRARSVVPCVAAVALVLALTFIRAGLADAQSPCDASDLDVVAGVGTDRALLGNVIFTNQSANTCTLEGFPSIQILDANGAALTVMQLNILSPAGRNPPPISVVTLQPTQQASAFIGWANFCQQPLPLAPFSQRITLSGDGSLTTPLTAGPEGSTTLISAPPACENATLPSTLEVTPVQAETAVPHDSRYYPQTGFRIDSDTIDNYFNRRGGVATFGYPVSRTFLFQGFTVQFFQRRVVQIGPDGHARLLNVLDPGMLPYTSFNFASVPGFDTTLAATAPDPANAGASLAFVQAHAPDRFQDLPVNFYQTFLDTVPAPVAFPLGGHLNLLTGFDLEMWGLPTSQPTFDPNNHAVVYLRFQRGIMVFDAGCACTRSLLLADYLKSVITGVNLPADLDQEAQGTPLYRQYDPSQPVWVHLPALLPTTNLTEAFAPE